MIEDRGEEFEGCKRAVGDQDNIAVGEPAVDLQCGLMRPIEQRLGDYRICRAPPHKNERYSSSVVTGTAQRSR
jgi:hypothetical protein